jgi:uncharacterized protein
VPIAGAAPLPLGRLSFTVADGELVPAWLGDRDRPWLRDLLAAAEAFVGRPFAELALHWRRSDPDPRAGRRHAAAVHVLAHWLRTHAVRADRRAARLALFELVASGHERDHALAVVAAQHRVAVDELAATLYDDLPERRAVRWPEPPPEPGNLALAANTALVRGMLRRAVAAELQVHGGSRTLLKTAWLLGAVPTIRSEPVASTTMSWPDTRTTRHAALPAIVSLLPWARRYRLRATIVLPHARGDLVLTSGDPLLPAPEPRPFDSALEREFARDFVRLLPDWEVVREPTAIVTGDTLAFPDFELRPRSGGPSWLCEVAGLRDPGALPNKVALLTRCPRLVLCLPECHVTPELRQHPRVVPFRRRVDVHAVRAVIER